jgi:hypothetical protein
MNARNTEQTTDQKTNPKQQSNFWKPIWISAAQETGCILREHRINYPIDNSRPLAPILKKETPEIFKFSYFIKNNYNITILPKPIFRSVLTTSESLTKKK